MEDTTSALNEMMQGYLDQALIKANKAGSCKASSLEDPLRSLTEGLFWAKPEEDIEKSNILDRRGIALNRSIYQDIYFIEGPALYLAALGFLMKVGDFYIGSDKLGHFIDQGYLYHRSASLTEGLEYGERAERTYLGLESTAIYSYGDLAANYDGYRFWTQVTGGKDPYFSCNNKVWTQKRRFDITEYANPAWDEGINCSLYRNKRITQAVRARIANLGLTCPVDKTYCKGMIERYGDLAPRIITPECNRGG